MYIHVQLRMNQKSKNLLCYDTCKRMLQVNKPIDKFMGLPPSPGSFPYVRKQIQVVGEIQMTNVLYRDAYNAGGRARGALNHST